VRTGDLGQEGQAAEQQEYSQRDQQQERQVRPTQEEADQGQAVTVQRARWRAPDLGARRVPEEYRCSLSAQELGTTEPVSEPRLRARLAALQAWLDSGGLSPDRT